MCPAWTGFSLETGGTEDNCVRWTVKLLCHSVGMGPRGVTGIGLPHVHPLGFIPGGTCWVRDAGAGATCLMPNFSGDMLDLDAHIGNSSGHSYSSQEF